MTKHNALSLNGSWEQTKSIQLGKKKKFANVEIKPEV